jgi:hypothetical protein
VRKPRSPLPPLSVFDTPKKNNAHKSVATGITSALQAPMI